jgi:hypothetical protein
VTANIAADSKAIPPTAAPTLITSTADHPLDRSDGADWSGVHSIGEVFQA